MTPHYTDPWLTVYLGDCREVMAQMEPESVHCVVTSPPYWGLRDYGQPGQLGLEPTPEEYVADMVAVFRDVRRVLRSDGTVWLNLGDSFGAKQLIGIPWRVAFALQADGWYLRSDIIWSKPNPMPESVTDRPTKSHEYLFLLSKSPRYYFDADAVREGRVDSNTSRAEAIDRLGTTDGIPTGAAKLPDSPYHAHKGARRGLPGVGTTFVADPAGRNLRSVWTIATQPYPGAHFATFPRALVEPCIKAGSSEKGVCSECGAPWVREVAAREVPEVAPSELDRYGTGEAGVHRKVGGQYQKWLDAHPLLTTGWRPSCAHPQSNDMAAPATVLDPFAGSGTTGMVAQSLSRRAVLIDLNADYLTQVMDRNRDIPLGLAIEA